MSGHPLDIRRIPGSWVGKGPYFLLALAILAADQWTKALVEGHFSLHTGIEVIPGFFQLSHVRNTGVAFGIFASQDGTASPALVAFTILALGAVLLYLRLVPLGERRLLGAVGLLLGGAAGNLLDRLAAGAVTDFLDVSIGSHHWPAFNVADSAITVGIGLLILDTFLGRPAATEDSPTDASGETP
jgi:signal peptidase II